MGAHGLGWRSALCILAGALLGLAADAPAEPPPAGPAPQVELDRLLKLPSSLDYSVQSRGGMTPGEWRARFRSLRDALRAEREALRGAEARLDEVAAATNPWQIAPPLPGGSAAEAPLDFQLRQEIRRHREEIEHLEGQLRELEIEANLAGVPEDWRF